MKIRKTHLVTKSVYVPALKKGSAYTSQTSLEQSENKEKTLESHASVTAGVCFFKCFIEYELKKPYNNVDKL